MDDLNDGEFFDEPYEDEDWREEQERRDGVYKIISDFQKEFNTVSLSLDTLPSCCSALVLSGLWLGGARYKKNSKQVPREKLVGLVKDIIAQSTPGYAFLISTLLMPMQEEWASVLKEAGFEESGQIAASNDYNGSVPLRVYIKSLRPMTEDEIKSRVEKQRAKQAKGGYEW